MIYSKKEEIIGIKFRSGTDYTIEDHENESQVSIFKDGKLYLSYNVGEACSELNRKNWTILEARNASYEIY